MIEPLIPPQTALQDRLHDPLPTCVIRGTADPDLAYGVAVIGDAGRVADRAVLSALSWSPGTRLTMSCTEGCLVLMCAASEGHVQVDRCRILPRSVPPTPRPAPNAAGGEGCGWGALPRLRFSPSPRLITRLLPLRQEPVDGVAVGGV